MSNPSQIRRLCKNARRNLTPGEQQKHALSVAKNIQTIPWVQRSKRIAGYVAVDGELDLGPCFSRLRRAGKHLYLPVIRPRPQRRLWFAAYTIGSVMLPNRFAIPEPRLGRNSRRKASMLDVILVPLVAFDTDCRRLGMGGGFYDRTLAHRRRNHFWQRPHLIGVAHECQRVATLPSKPWDVIMDAIVTESAIYR